MPVKYALFCDNHTQPVRRPINYTCAHAATRALPAGDNRIHAQEIQMPDEGCSPERAGRDFLEHSFARNWFDFVNDIVTSAKAIQLLGRHSRTLFGIAPESPRLDRNSVHAGDMDDRNADFARLSE